MKLLVVNTLGTLTISNRVDPNLQKMIHMKTLFKTTIGNLKVIMKTFVVEKQREKYTIDRSVLRFVSHQSLEQH